MTFDRAGTLRLQPSGRWAVRGPGQTPFEIAVADVFRIEVDGMRELQVSRMEFRHFQGPMKGGALRGLPGEYHLVDGY